VDGTDVRYKLGLDIAHGEYLCRTGSGLGARELGLATSKQRTTVTTATFLKSRHHAPIRPEQTYHRSSGTISGYLYRGPRRAGSYTQIGNPSCTADTVHSPASPKHHHNSARTSRSYDVSAITQGTHQTRRLAGSLQRDTTAQTRNKHKTNTSRIRIFTDPEQHTT